MRSSRRRRNAFTLIEVLLVLVILAALAGFAVMNYGNVQRKAKIDQAKSQVGMLSPAIDTFQLQVGQYPSSLDALLQPPADIPNPMAWGGPYLKSAVPLDPWGSPYLYKFPGQQNPDSYDVYSLGPDGVDGSDDDIGNW